MDHIPYYSQTLLQRENNHENIYIIIEGNILIGYPHKTIFFINIAHFGKW